VPQSNPLFGAVGLEPDSGSESMRMSESRIELLDGRITIDPAVCNGRPTIRGKRITVQTILEYLGAGDSEEEILRQYPSLEREDLRACLRFAAGLLDQGFSVSRVA